MKYHIPLVLILVHYFADFVLQTDWQAQNKSKDWNALVRHTAVYSACFLPFGLLFAVITFVTHTATDAVTSRINSHFAKKQDWHNFFVCVGADQVIHYLTLAATYYWVLNNVQ